VDITEVGPADEAGLRAFWSVGAAARPVDVPLIPVAPFEELAAERPDERSMRHHRWLAWQGGQPVGAAHVVLPMLDNAEAAHLSIEVLPDARRRGIGRALLATASGLMSGKGRTHAIGDAAEPLAGGGTPGAAFATAVGAERALEEICRVLELDGVTDEQLAAHEDAAMTRAVGYSLVRWVGPCSDDIADDLAVLTGRMITDAPMGDLAWEAEVWDRARIRESEERNVRLGRNWVTTAARDAATGQIVAYSDIGWSQSQEEVAYQWMTIVDPAHRGRRLGLLIKAATLRLLRRELPDATRVITWNAESNTHMIAINETLGFRPRLRFCQWQLKLPA
jgi:GNAT superfamily N-acetyltransferase